MKYLKKWRNIITMTNKLKVKDFILIALLTALYMVIYMLSMLLITPLGAFGHAISPGICAVFSGTVIYFMSKKLGKMWQFTIMTTLVMACFTLLGGGYIPWYITSIGMAIIADLLASKQGKDVKVIKVAIASGIMHVGQAWGAIIPATFFLDRFKSYWIMKGQSAAEMESHIKYTAGVWGLTSSIIVFILAVFGAYLGYFILRKHFKES